MQALLETFHEAYGFPGVTVAYVAADGNVRSFAVGFSDVEGGVPMAPETRMLAASVGKTIWGALVLSLEADGLINRSDLLSDYLGDKLWFARVPNADDMTIGHLLTHTSGLPDHVHMDGVAAELMALGRADTFDPTELVSFVLDEPALFDVGTAWSYSDTGYILLGLAMEAATEASVFELAAERLLLPLGLTATVPSDTTALEGIAVGYTVDDNPFGLAPRTMNEDGRLTWNPVVEWTGGGFASTSTDLALWGHALFAGTAIDADYLSTLLDGVVVNPDAPGVLYAAGIAIYQETRRGPVYGHGGWIPGYVSSLRHYADHDLTIAFQINTDVGVVDDSTDLVPALEAALTDALIGPSAD
ncbi:beta-lactamase family protein [Tropicibacter sp. R15_0]|uniref:serine hydrolase domain-containing protein n=1 Tax=Tropicibacter sp. R15_0 TaxID=2821101 RepID=UPI001ADAC0E7|nr:beta-lactamase family protein [Tropicibacter sp. R15_0]